MLDKRILKKIEVMYVYALISPFLLRLLLPETLELFLTIDIGGFSMFIPELFYLLIPFLYLKQPDNIKKNYSLAFLAILGIITQYMGSINGGMYNYFNNFLAGIDFYIMVFVFSLFPLSYIHFKILKIPIITTLIIICLEIVLYSFGILKYSESLGDQEYGGITRISTTIGAATGTAVAVLLLLGIAYPLVNPKKEIVKNSILYFSGAAILITLSRGSIIAFMIILTIFLYKKYFQNKLKNIFKNIFKVAFSLIIAFLIGNNFGIFDSVLERSNSLNSNENLSSGRFDRWQSSFEFISESPIIGNGPNYYTILKRARHMDIDSLDLFSPHNTFFLILMQTGIIGFLVFLAILVTMCRQLRISNIGISGIVFYTTILISMNTEIVFVFMEFTGLFMLLWNISLIEKKQCLKTTE